jgi:hypothetical protein
VFFVRTVFSVLIVLIAFLVLIVATVCIVSGVQTGFANPKVPAN